MSLGCSVRLARKARRGSGETSALLWPSRSLRPRERKHGRQPRCGQDRTRWTASGEATEQDTPVTIPQQVPLPPIQVSPSREETNMSTGDSIIPPPPWFDETPQPPSSTHEDVPAPVPSFDETPFVTAPVPETPTLPSVAKRWRSGALHSVPATPTIPSVAKRWRSDTLHLENPISVRWRSDTFHPETPVPTPTPPHLRWRAGVLRAVRPFRRLRHKHSDPSEVSVKRSRLAPAQVMSTALAKHCDWSLGFDERGPVFDETQDVRQGKRSILLQNLQRISLCCLRP